MIFLFKLAHRIAKLRAAPLAAVGLLIAGCSKGERTDFLSPNPNSNLPVLALIRVEPQINSVQVGSEIQFTATGYSTGGSIIPVNVDWSATGGIITPDGRYTGVLTGTFTVKATSREKPSVSDSARIGVWETGDELVALVVSPDSAMIDEGQSVEFSAALRMARGALTGSAAVSWSASGGDMTTGGRFTAAEPGEYTISALSVNNLRGSAKVFVRKKSLQLRRIRVTPASVTMKPQRDTTFTARAEWADGSVTSAQVEWSSTGGTINGSGDYHSVGPAGSYRVIATDRATGLADTSGVTITPPGVSKVVVSPKSLSVSPGAFQQFVAQAQLADGSWSALEAIWEATSGTVTQNGGYNAPTTPGTYRVISTAPATSLATGDAGAAVVAPADTALVTVIQPVATLTRLLLNPSSAVIEAGGSRTFSVTGMWSDGSSSTPAVTWTATGGSIDATGRYVAGQTVGSYRVIATAGNGLADTSAVTVTSAMPVRLDLTPATATLSTGASQTFSASATWSDGSVTMPPVTYTASGGTISPSGFFVAGTTAGTFSVIASMAGGSLADTSFVTISSPPPTLTGVLLTPTSVALAPGAGQQFTAVGVYSNGSTASVGIAWSATGGTISGTGLYTAGSTPGTYRVVARQSGGTRADTSVVTITSPPTLTSLTLSPKPASMQTGATLQFSASAGWSDGSAVVPPLVWTATGGSVSSSGLYTAGATAGTFRVVATHQGGTRSDTSVVTLTPPPSASATLVSLTIAPKPTSLQTGTTRQFAVSATWSDGSTTVPTLTWNATGGTITPGGLYTAGNTAGTFRAIASGGGKADTAAITVTAPPVPTLTSLTIAPKPASVQTGGTQQFTVSALWSDGSTTVPGITWSATGGSITAGGLYTAGSRTGNFRVIASGGGKADTNVITLTAPVVTTFAVSPKQVVVATGGTQQFASSATWSDGVNRAPAVSYTAGGGTVTMGGLFTAGTVSGTFVLVASCSCGKSDTAFITIPATTAPVISRLTLSPSTVTLTPGGTQQFSTTATWSDGTTTSPPVVYSTTGGSISPAGSYVAPSITGVYQVVASSTLGTLQDTSEVIVQASGTGTPPVGNLFNVNFDDGTLGGMSAWGVPPARVVVDSTARGGKSVQFDYSAGSEQNIGLLATVSAGKKIHVRVRYKQAGTADNSGIKKTIRIRGTIDGIRDRAIGTLDIQWGRWNFFGDDFGDGDNHFQSTGTESRYGPDSFRGVWRYVELMVDYSTPGFQKSKVWVDGMLILDVNQALTTPMPSTLNIDWVYLGSIFNGPSDTRSDWLDDVAIGTSYIGIP